MSEQNSNNNLPMLRCLGGNQITCEGYSLWQKFISLFNNKKEILWESLEFFFLPQEDIDLDKEILSFCHKHHLLENDIKSTLELVHYLIMMAIKYDLTYYELTNDLNKLNNAPNDLISIVASRYETTKNYVRRRIISDAIISHSNFVPEVKWRVQNIEACDSGYHLNIPTITLTFLHNASGVEHKVSYTFLLETLLKLRNSINEIENWVSPQEFRFINTKSGE